MIIQGKAISPGVAIGSAYPVDAGSILSDARDVPPHGPPELELERLRAAVAWAGAQLKRIKRQLGQHVAKQDVAIFDTHASILLDLKFTDLIERQIIQEGKSAEAAVSGVVLSLYDVFSSSQASLLEDKAADLLDIGRRLVQCLSISDQAVDKPSGPTIVVADELAPSELVHYAHQGAVGFVSAVCGTKSHTAILARGLGLPLITGIPPGAFSEVRGAEIIVDGRRGSVIVRPTADEQRQARAMVAQVAAVRSVEAAQPAEAVTTDGSRIKLLLNISDLAEAAAVKRLGADGVGLFRTEFLYMDRAWWPSEEESYEVYRQIAEAIGDTELHIRLADFGAEKCPPYAEIPVNRNPSLGLRGIRLLLSREDILRPQLRAIARLARQRPLTLLLPMLDTLDTLELTTRKICSILGCGSREQLPFRLGAMIELPSAAFMIDEIADRVDSLAIGLNDLTQYVLAADRDDELVEAYHDALQPAVLRLVSQIVEAGDRRATPVTACGELAGDPTLTSLLLGMGLRRLSVSSTSYPGVLQAIRSSSLADGSKMAEEVSRLASGAAVRERVARLKAPSV